jgi:hypothetical protein
VCEGHSREEIEAGLKLLQDNGILRLEKAKAKEIVDGIKSRLDGLLGPRFEYLESVKDRLAEKLGIGETEEFVIPLIKCELLNLN